MTRKSEEILKWQDDVKRCQLVWFVINQYGDIAELYDSKEAAELDCEARNRRDGGQGLFGYRVDGQYVHTLDLAERRWGPNNVFKVKE